MEERETATRLAGDDEAGLYLRQDAAFLSIAITAEDLAVASLCLASGDTVLVLHASAALGHVAYMSQGDAWQTADAFTWELRGPAMTEAVLQERRAYLERTGWVATTMRMGTPGEVEFLLQRDRLPEGNLYVAAGLMPEARPDAILPLPADAAGAWADYDLVAGSPPTNLYFQPESWVSLPEMK